MIAGKVFKKDFWLQNQQGANCNALVSTADFLFYIPIVKKCKPGEGLPDMQSQKQKLVRAFNGNRNGIRKGTLQYLDFCFFGTPSSEDSCFRFVLFP